MKRLLPFIICLTIASAVQAQRNDSLFVQHQDHGWAIRHAVKAGETVFSLARKYHTPPAILADVNEINYQTALVLNQKVMVPLGAYNQLKAKPEGQEYRPLYYRVKQDDDLHAIARASAVSMRTVQQWNGMMDNELMPGKVLTVGWVLYDNTALPTAGTKTEGIPVRQPMTVAPAQPVNTGVAKQPIAALSRPKGRDTVIIIKKPKPEAVPVVDSTESEEERQYLVQTSNEERVETEKGPVSFYGSAKGGGSNGTFYAFHNTVAKGTIIKVHNPGSDKTIYVKVLGPMPATRLYHNSVLGISSKAREALGAATEKAWCELSYAR
jgi:LysM repeat protein